MASGRGEGALFPGRGGPCALSACVTPAGQRDLGAGRCLADPAHLESEQGRAHLSSPPGPWAALQGSPSTAAHTPPGNQTSEGLLLAISEHEQQMSDVLVMLFQSLGVQSDPDHLGACYDPQSPSPVPAVLAGPSGTPVPAGKSLTSRLSEGTEGRVSGAGAQDPSSLSWDGREV